VRTVHAKDHGVSVRVLTLDRPPANAIDDELLADISAALDDALADDGVRAIVLTGAGRFFSGGLDLSGAIEDGAAVRRRLDNYRNSQLQLLKCPKPTVAMMNGHAIAGGLVLALACDWRVAGDGDFQIGLNEVAIGAAFPKVAFETVRLRLTSAQANELLLGAALYPVQQAVALGAVDELVPAESLEEAAVARASGLGAFPREAYAHTKLALVADAVARVEAEPVEEAIRGAAVWMTPESIAAREAQRRRLGKKDST